MTITYQKGSVSIGEQVDRIIEQFHPDLIEADIRIIEASALQAGTPVRMSKPTPGDKVDGHDLVLIYDGGVLSSVPPDVCIALLDHAISGWQGVGKQGRKGAPLRTVYQPRKPLRMHLEVLERHGAVIDAWKDAHSRIKQLPLPMTVKLRVRRRDGGDI